MTEYTNAIGETFASYTGYIQSLLAIYKPGTTVVPVTGKAWGITQARRDRKARYVPGARESQVEWEARDGALVVRRTQTIHDHQTPYVTERHRLKGCAPVARTTVKVITWTIPASAVKAMRNARRRKKVNLLDEAAKIVAKAPGVPLNYDTWRALLGHVAKLEPGRPAFAKCVRRVGAIKGKATLGTGAWGILALPWPDGRHVPPAHSVKVPMALAGGLRPSKNHLRLARGLRPKGRCEAWTYTQAPVGRLAIQVVNAIVIAPVMGPDGYAGLRIRADMGRTVQWRDGSFEHLA